ncbi:MAG: hypothetical protein JWO84_209 [Parcubacteria group bacterium]|nr:hypothetical protein [Parcubacteria group bacterium]
MPHIHEKMDWCVEVFIVHENTVLLRKHDKYKEWYSVGGHVELDEDSVEAAIREVKEEVGIDVALLGLDGLRHFSDGSTAVLAPPFINRHFAGDTAHEHLTLVYFGTAPSKELKPIEGREESEGLRWFTEADLADPAWNLRENIVFYAKAALEAAKK